MNRHLIKPSHVRLLAFLIGSIVWGLASGVVADETITVRLYERARVPDRLVRMRHLAEVTGRNATDVDRVRELDVMQLNEESGEHVLPREQLEIRLLLAGIPLERVSMSGAEAVTVSCAMDPPFASLDVEQATTTAMALALGVPPEDVRVKLAAPLELPDDGRFNQRDRYSIDVLPPVRPTPGRVRLTIRLLVDGELHHTVSGLFDVRVRRTVVLASASLPSGTVLTADHLSVSDEWSDERPVVADVTNLFDRQLRRPIPAGEAIGPRDLTPLTVTKSQPVVATRDLVRLVVRQGNLTVVVPTAEALQSGRLGETIRVRNLESRKVLVGRIVSAGEVEVSLE